MRVSLGLQMNSTAGYLREAAEKMLDAQRVVTTGKKISRPSDDPTLANRSMSIRSSINGIVQYQENTKLAKSVLDSSEAAVSSIADQMYQLQQVASQAGDGALSDVSKTSLLAQIKDIRQRVLGLAGTKYLDRYLFSGTSGDTAPIAATGANPPYSYQGDGAAIRIQVQPNEKIQTNVTANELFNLDGSAGAGIKDVFTVMQDLETAVKAGDVDTCSNLLADIQANHSNVLGIQAEIGARSGRLDDNALALTDSKNRLSDLLSNLEDADLPSAIINLQTQQNVYQAALSVTSQLMQRTLADYLS